MLGVGLGGFMQGFQGGMNARAAMDERKRNKVIQDRQDTEYNRTLSQRNEIDAINTGAKQEFDARVSAGTEKPENYDQFWSDYALPKLKNTYLAQGNIDMANKVQAWGETEDAKVGARFAMSALSKAQTGDAAGALKDAMEAGKRKGYIAHGYEISGQDSIVDKDGKLLGYRLYMKGADGKEIQQDLPTAQVPKLIATYLNPQAAWDSQVAAQNEKSKTAGELATYEEKKKIDKKYGNAEDKTRSEAITALRKRMDGGLAGTEPKFDGLSRDEQEKLISEEIGLQKGVGLSGQTASAPAAAPETATADGGRKVLVDTATGRAVDPLAVQKPAAASQERPAPQRSAPQSRSENVAYLLQAAEKAVSEGIDPARIADELSANGIPEDQWPTSLKTAAANQKRVGYGLGK